MKESDKKRLQINCRDLVSNIAVSDIQDYLYEKDVITAANLEALGAEKYRQKAVRYLVVSLLPRKGPNAFKVFCDALREANYEYLAEKLENTNIDRGGASECQDNKCVEERNSLRKKSVVLESQLEKVKQEVSSFKIESDTRNKKTRRNCSDVEGTNDRLEQLEYENYKLKKQLSFYEEPVVSSNGATARTPRSIQESLMGSEGSGDSVFYSGPSDMNDIYVDVDDLPESLCDRLDGDVEDFDEEEAESNHRIQFTPNFSRQEHHNDEETLIEVLTADIINCMYNQRDGNIHLLNPQFSEYVLALRRAVRTMSQKHDALFQQISQQVELNATWREINEQMASLFHVLLADEYNNDGLTWGKILALFSLTGYVAKRCASKDKVALPLGDFLAKFIEKKLNRKIRKLGGWDSFCKLTEKGELNITCVFPAALIEATVMSTKQRAERNRTNSLGRTLPSKLLDKRNVSGSNISFKKTW